MNKISISLMMIVLLIVPCSYAFAGSAMNSVSNYKRMEQSNGNDYSWQAEQNRQQLEQILINQEREMWRRNL